MGRIYQQTFIDTYSSVAEAKLYTSKHPQTNGICERFNKTILEEFYSIVSRKKIYLNIEELQKDLDVWLKRYNTSRPHQGKRCQGRTPMETFMDNLPLVKDIILDMKFILAA